MGLRSASTIINLKEAQVNEEEMDSVKTLMATLAVLGGHGDRMRTGCRVELKINEEDDAAMAEKGVCIAINRSSGLCQVLFDNVKRPVTIQISKVMPISEVSALGIIPINDELLEYLTIFTEPIHFESRDPNKYKTESGTDEDEESDTKSSEITKEKEKEKTPKLDDVMQDWNCPQCTFINPAQLHICSM